MAKEEASLEREQEKEYLRWILRKVFSKPGAFIVHSFQNVLTLAQQEMDKDVIPPNISRHIVERSVASRVLDVQEMLNQIIADVDLSESVTNPRPHPIYRRHRDTHSAGVAVDYCFKERRDFARLALVGRKWREPVIPRLWASMRGHRPMLSPPSARRLYYVELIRVLKLENPFGMAHWTRTVNIPLRKLEALELYHGGHHDYIAVAFPCLRVFHVNDLFLHGSGEGSNGREAHGQ